MIAYVYNLKENNRIDTYKNVNKVSSTKTQFKLHTDEGVVSVKKDNIKIVIYGF